ncbi:MAG: O-methyltransferase [Bacteroides sp.]|nr:O-methyltransferase [Bacteroides sp.]
MTSELDDYIAAHTSEEPRLLRDLYRATYLERLYPRMCSGHVQGRILAMLSQMIRPRRVLELGTFTGYSALCLAEGLADDGQLHTVEIDDEAEGFIRRWFDRSEHGSRITLHIGDALEVVPGLGEEWDLVYIDANKRIYRQYLDMVLPMMRKGGFIIADNTLWDGKVTDQSATDAQTRGIRDFNDYVTSHPRLESVILPLRDGLTLLRVKS